MWRKTQELGLATTYTDRGAEYRYIRSLLALPFLPHTDVERAFMHLEQRANSMELQQLTRYMRTTRLENPYWSPRTWSIYQQRMWTNNDVEGWHTHLIANAGRANLTFYLLVPLQRREADLVDITHRLIREEQILWDHRSKFSWLQEQLQDLWEKNANDDLSASQLLKEWVCRVLRTCQRLKDVHSREWHTKDVISILVTKSEMVHLNNHKNMYCIFFSAFQVE